MPRFAAPGAAVARLSRYVLWLLFVAAWSTGFSGACKKKSGPAPTAPSASASSAQVALSPELAAKTLVKVGDRTITLGEYAATLERMDPFERLRYQSPERRKQLMDEMVEVELLAQEAKRRGLDKDPETEQRLREILRDELLNDLKKDLPNPSSLPEADVRAYYAAHQVDFNDPERRRAAAIALATEDEAKKVLAQASKATPETWGKLVAQYNKDKKLRPGPPPPTELAGDLGIVGPPGDARSANPRVPEPIRAALFKIEKVGDTFGDVVKNEDQFYVVRMTGRTDARARTYEEAERAIRVAMVQAQIRDRETSLEKELRQKFPVKIDEVALAKLVIPSASAPQPASSAPAKP